MWQARFRRIAGVLLGLVASQGFGQVPCEPATSTSQAASEDQPPEPTLASLRESVRKAIPLLERGARGSMEHRPNCFTCHNQGIPLIALTTARSRGFAIDKPHLQQQADFIAKFLERNRQRFLDGKGTGGEIATAGTALWALNAAEWRADETTKAVAEYLLLFDAGEDHWRMTSDRPPSEHSHFTATYLAIRGLQQFASDDQVKRRDERLPRVRQWLQDTPVKETEDRVFRLWSLKALAAPDDRVREARDELMAAQRPDGGWSQLPDLPSDAYATGTVLVALHQAADLATSDAVYQRGLAFLVQTQTDDGSWQVTSRSKPFQTYFESGFPHGKDQFISITASAWATTALALACPLSDESSAESD